jgi:ribonuclease BN (tRNA processing enzyme)
MPDLELTILGSASGMPEPDRSHAAIALRRNDGLWLLDAGEGVSSALLRWGLNPELLKGIYITHLHPDHCVGMFMVLQYLHIRQWTGHLDIYIPGGAIDVFQKFMDQLYLVHEEICPQYALKALGARHQLADDLILETSPTKHLERWDDLAIPGIETGAYAFRITNSGHSIFYSGDIDSVADVAPYVRAGDILILESAHIDYDEVLKMAVELTLKRLILTHALPDKHPVLRELHYRAEKDGIRVDIAEDGMKLVV